MRFFDHQLDARSRSRRMMLAFVGIVLLTMLAPVLLATVALGLIRLLQHGSLAGPPAMPWGVVGAYVGLMLLMTLGGWWLVAGSASHGTGQRVHGAPPWRARVASGAGKQLCRTAAGQHRHRNGAGCPDASSACDAAAAGGRDQRLCAGRPPARLASGGDAGRAHPPHAAGVAGVGGA